MAEEALRADITGRVNELRGKFPSTYARIVRRLQGLGIVAIEQGTDEVYVCCSARGIDVLDGPHQPDVVVTTDRALEALLMGRSPLELLQERTLDVRGTPGAHAALEEALRLYVGAKAGPAEVSPRETADASSTECPAGPRPLFPCDAGEAVGGPPGWAEKVRVATRKRPVVTVFGAGVTGLTAAHELAERGFVVQVVERTRALDVDSGVQVGGVARTFFARLPLPERGEPVAGHHAAADPTSRYGMLRATKRRELRPYLEFARAAQEAGVGTPAWGALEDRRRETNDQKVERLVDGLRALADDVGSEANAVTVVVRGRYRAITDAGLALQRATAVKEHLVGKLGDLAKRVVLVPRAVPHTRPWSTKRGERGQPYEDRVDFLVAERRAPGEHGYRFFPAFYRNLFDTMRRTPLYDEGGRETGQAVYDNLVPTSTVALGIGEGGEGQVVAVARERPRSLEGIREALRDLRQAVGLEPRDVALFELRLLRYLTSSAARRRRLEAVSWREYMRLDTFSPRFRRFLEDAPQALVAMATDEIDARTHANVSVQLLLDQLTTGDAVDMTLNGPTTTAWLGPWKDHLKRQGVRFFHGTLTAVAREGERLAPTLEAGDPRHDRVVPGKAGGPWPEGDEAFVGEADYYVLATPLEAAWALLPEKGPLDGDLAALRDWKRQVARELGSAWNPVSRDLPRDEADRAVGPFRDFAGIQYYFPQGVRFGAEGHLYFPETPWGVSAVVQPPYWRAHRGLAVHGYTAVLSVDIGQLHVPGSHGKTARASSPGEIADEVWSQILARLGPPYDTQLAPPLWYHLDPYLHYGEDGEPWHNAAPFLVNRPEDARWRPGEDPRGAPERPAAPERRPAPEEAPKVEGLDVAAGIVGTSRRKRLEGGPTSLFQGFSFRVPEPAVGVQRTTRASAARRGIRYTLADGRWAVAGPHMRTYTRMTTTEAANESARHAVNAILADYACREDGVLLGDYCPVWDPEDHELADLAPLKRLDELLFARDLPHFLDILQAERLADLPEPMEAQEKLRGLLADVRTLMEKELRKEKVDGLDKVLDLAKKVEDWVLGKLPKI